MSDSELTLAPLPANSSIAVEISDQPVLVCNSNGKHFAVQNRCTHQDTPLEKGRVRNGFISCPLHGVRFSLETGVPMGVELTRIPLRTYAVVEEEGMIKVDIEAPGETG